MPDTFLRIAGITLAIRCSDPRVACRFDEPVARFLIDPAPPDVALDVKPDVQLDVEFLEHYDPPRGELLFDSGGVWRMFAEEGGTRIDCHSAEMSDAPYKVATFNSDFTRGTIRINSAVFTEPIDPLGYPLDELLIANLLGRGRGVELHACGIVDHSGRGHLFVGQSGAGKSTTARLWGDEAREIVSDDRVIVREQEGTLWIHGTPWHGEASLSSPSRAPLFGVYLLIQASENELRELSAADAVARLFACAFPPFHDPQAVAFTMSMLERIVSRVPVREFRFTLDRSALDLIRREAA
jgi:hypothetical protein